jgi:hypothetical protein
MDEEAERILQDMMAKLGGIQHHPRQQEVMQALNRFIPMLPGHWGGWMFATFPTVTHIEFLNAERTRATARFTVEYEGATVILEKVNGRWVAVRMVDRWIT